MGPAGNSLSFPVWLSFANVSQIIGFVKTTTLGGMPTKIDLYRRFFEISQLSFGRNLFVNVSIVNFFLWTLLPIILLS
jgi:hypothetical protein